eukprot:scaffold133_cov257-Pinguiococcus_pyrenoidosus.AAC.13
MTAPYLIVEQLLVRLCCELEVRALDNGVNWAGLGRAERRCAGEIRLALWQQTSSTTYDIA